jgi:hypothetical protein
MSFDRPPAFAFTAAPVAWLIFDQTTLVTLIVSADMQALIFSVVSVPAVIVLTAALYAPGTRDLLTRGARRRALLTAPRWPAATTHEARVGT